MPHAYDFVGGRFQVAVRNNDQIDAMARFDMRDINAFFVQQESADIHGYLAMQGTGVVLHGFFFKNAQDVQRGGFSAADMACAGAARAGNVAGFSQGRAQALAREFEQAKAADFACLHACAVVVQGVAQAVFYLALVLGRFHVDKVDHNQAAQIAQAQLACDFIGRFAVGAECGFFNIAAAGGTAGVHVNRHQRFGVVNHNRAA